MALKHCPECHTVMRADRIERYKGQDWCAPCQRLGPWALGSADLVVEAVVLVQERIARSAVMVTVDHPASIAYQRARGVDVTRLGVNYEADVLADQGSERLKAHGWIDAGGVKWTRGQKGGHRSYDRRVGT